MEIKIDTSTATKLEMRALRELLSTMLERDSATSDDRVYDVVFDPKPTPMDVRDDDEPRGPDGPVVSAVKSIASDISTTFKENVRAEMARDAGDDVPTDPNAPRDAAGIAWDARVHTSNQATKQDGTWKRKPGLDDAYYDGIMAELAENVTTPDTPATTPETPAAQAFAPPSPPTASAHTFLSNVRLFTQHGIKGEQLKAVLAEAGVEDVGALATADAATQTKFAELITAAGEAQ